jgi:hypothetical protein
MLGNETRGKMIGIDVFLTLWGLQIRVQGDIEILDAIFDLDKRVSVEDRIKISDK